jgi:hypothetical protein
MIRRDALERVGGFSQPERMPAVDYPTWMALSDVGPVIGAAEVLGLWRVHGSNSSTSHVVALARGSRRMAVARAAPSERGEVERHWRGVESDVQRSVGRSALARGEWNDARAAFRDALKLTTIGRPLPLLKSVAGLALSGLHVAPPGHRGREST